MRDSLAGAAGIAAGLRAVKGGEAWENESTIYLETTREEPSLEVGHAMAHECGHAGGADDDACELGCIMYIYPGSGLSGDNFCGQCLRKFREDATY